MSDSTMWSGLLHGGLAGTWQKVPFVPAQADRLREHGARAAVYGLPFDGTNISRTGANGGPRQMRDVSCMTLTYNAYLDVDVVEALALVDTGDCAVQLGSPSETYRRAQADISAIVAAGAVPVVLGGDHGSTIPAVRAVKEHLADPGFVLVDSHLDTAQDVGGELESHCCPASRALDAGFDPAKMVIVGVNGWLNPRSELAYCREHGITVIWLEEIWERGARWAAERAVEVAGAAADGIYLSFDIDALDSAHGVGTCVPTTAGMSGREPGEIVRIVAGAHLCGGDVVEVAPTPTPATCFWPCTK